MSEIIAELSNGRMAMGQETAEERRLTQVYGTARNEVQQPFLGTPDERAVLQTLRRFDADPAMRAEVLNRFFSPAVRERSIAFKRQMDAGIAEMRRRGDAFGGTAQQSQQGQGNTGPGGVGPGGIPDPSSADSGSTWMESLLWYGVPALLIIFWLKRMIDAKAEPARNSNAEMARLGNSVEERTRKIEEIFNRKSDSLSFDLKGKNNNVKIRAHIIRSLAAMPARERETLRAVYHLYNIGHSNPGDFYYSRLTLIYGDGKGQISNNSFETPHAAPDFQSALKIFTGMTVESTVTMVLTWVNRAAKKDPNHPVIKLLTGRLLGGGAAAMSSSTEFVEAQGDGKKPAFILGIAEDTGKLVTYTGEGSVITVAPPGSGKTQCHVLPTLLTWKGPAVVLDVKGEIYEGTSKWRKENVGPVFKFSPLDPAKSHSYNPLSAVRSDPDFLWEDSRFLADMMIVPTEAKEKFWEERARDVLTAAIARACLTDDPEKRSLGNVLDVFHGVGWDAFVRELQARVDLRSMSRAGSSLGQMEPKTRDSVLQTGLSSLSAWDGDRIERATRKSDWNPLDLRNGSNTTIYICLKPNEVASYLSMLRVFIAQHIRILTSGNPLDNTAPILFLLDELPQLRNMPPVEDALVIGRQYGIRLWMFTQSLGQLKNAYPNAEGMIGSCALRMYMNPSLHDGTAQKISDDIGFQEGVLDAQRQKIVEAPILAGPEYKDFVILMPTSFKPIRVRKSFAY